MSTGGNFSHLESLPKRPTQSVDTSLENSTSPSFEMNGKGEVIPMQESIEGSLNRSTDLKHQWRESFVTSNASSSIVNIDMEGKEVVYPSDAKLITFGSTPNTSITTTGQQVLLPISQGSSRFNYLLGPDMQVGI